MDGRCGQGLLGAHPHAAQHHDDHSQNEEYAARHVDQHVGIVVLPAGAGCWGEGAQRDLCCIVPTDTEKEEKEEEEEEKEKKKEKKKCTWKHRQPGRVIRKADRVPRQAGVLA